MVIKPRAWGFGVDRVGQFGRWRAADRILDRVRSRTSDPVRASHRWVGKAGLQALEMSADVLADHARTFEEGGRR